MGAGQRANRSHTMSQIGGRNTQPEIRVRKALHALGYRFRLHAKGLPGKPDIVLPKYKTAIFVHGCFWHRHSCKKGESFPKTNIAFWEKKFRDNAARDRRVALELEQTGWKVVVIWECETKRSVDLAEKISASLPRRMDTRL